MFTRQTFNILAEVKQRTEFAKKGLLRAVLMLEISQKGLYTPREKNKTKQKQRKTISLFEYEARVLNL